MNLLIVDDEPDVISLFQQSFRREIRSGQVALSFADSGQSALDYLQQNWTPDKDLLILSDINMPGMSGLELLRHIKTNYVAPPPMMMITAYGDDDTHAQALAYGADDFLSKPVDFSVLKQTLLNHP